MRAFLRILLVAGLLLCGSGLVAPAGAMGQRNDDAMARAAMEGEPPDMGWPEDTITVENPPDFTGHIIDVELAVTPRQREVGLMFRQTMAEDHGMLFIFDTEEPVAFWMKNTLIPLDMVFIDSSGTVVSIHKGAKPLDKTVIPSGKPALAVLELNAGAADRLGIVPGTHIEHQAFSANGDH